MTIRTSKPSQYDRIKLSPGGTVCRTEVALDHQANIAVAYARKWLDAGPGSMKVDVRTAGVIRRALQLYMDHLSAPTIDAAQEARAVRICCDQRKAREDTQQAALARLEAATGTTSFPTFSAVLHGYDVAAEVADTDAKVQAILDDIARSQWGRMRRLKFDQEAQP